MKKKSFTLLLATTLAGSLLCSSCIGSFGLTNKLLTWNKGIDSKLVNELVFIALWVIPVYEISAVADLFIFNAIEFWSGENPVADAGSSKTIDTANGIYTVQTNEDGYSIRKEGEDETVDLIFDGRDKSWSVEANGENHKLFRYTGDGEAVVYLPDGQEMNIELNSAGILAFRQAIHSYSYAAR
ncbi:MAG: DUF3332 domain-containing protein [Tannerellaceae bacterium]|jgi:hypothetical protein|nr:DUF3332 domain-containing protein [Tannerellaceae bacterium]